MTSQSLALRVSAYLDSVARNYPFGVPKQTQVAQTKRLCFVVLSDGSGDFLESESGQLLVAAVTKGLKLSMHDVEVVQVSNSAVVPMSQIRSKVVVVLGDNCVARIEKLAGFKLQLGSSCEIAGKLVILSRELQSSIADPVVKREFWGDLQKVQGMLR